MRGRPREFDRDEVLEQAMDAFWRQGYEATGVAELEQCTGLGRQSIYNAFGDKKALFTEALALYQEHYLQPLLDLLEGPGSPIGNLLRVLDLWDERAGMIGGRGCLLTNSLAQFGGSDKETAKALRQILERMERGFRTALTRAREAGELAADKDPQTLARLFTTVGQGLSVVGKVRAESFSRDATKGLRLLLE